MTVPCLSVWHEDGQERHARLVRLLRETHPRAIAEAQVVHETTVMRDITGPDDKSQPDAERAVA